MIKLVYCIRRKPELSREEFLRTWLEDHGPLVKRYANAIHAARYVQSHTRDDTLNDALAASRGLAAPYDGITEIWWNSRDHFKAGLASAEGAAAGLALLKDEQRFIDFSGSCAFLTDEHDVFTRLPRSGGGLSP